MRTDARSPYGDDSPADPTKLEQSEHPLGYHSPPDQSLRDGDKRSQPRLTIPGLVRIQGACPWHARSKFNEVLLDFLRALPHKKSPLRVTTATSDER